MNLKPGLWVGRGSYLPRGQSLTTPIELDFTVAQEDIGSHIKGTQRQKSGNGEYSFSLWITPNDYGTYELAAHFGDWRLTGTAKLDSLPHVGLLWSESNNAQVSFALFEIRGGFGLRGFARSSEELVTWEVALTEKQRAVKADNVVSLRPRR
jgi:hypothetical protein